jgi:exodeoxyribonuclease VII large subunit
VMELDGIRSRFDAAIASSLDAANIRLNAARINHRAHHPALVVKRRIEDLTYRRAHFERLGREILRTRQEGLDRLRGLLRALGPESAFQRGFSIALGPDGKPIRSAAALHAGDVLRTKFADGEVSSTVNHPG